MMREFDHGPTIWRTGIVALLDPEIPNVDLHSGGYPGFGSYLTWTND